TYGFDITNAGGSATGPVSVAVSGPDAALFTVDSDGCMNMPLMGGARCTVTVKFTAQSTGPKTATLTASASPGGQAPARLPATGAAPTALVSIPAMWDANEVRLGMQPTQTFTLQNTGSSASGMITIALIGLDAASFGLATDTCTTAALAPNATCSVTVVWLATTRGQNSAPLRAPPTPRRPAFAQPRC